MALVATAVLAGSGSAAAEDFPAAPVDSVHHATVDAGTYPWSSVAKLFNSVGGSCTGALIGQDKVLTAAHCLYAFRTRRFLPPEAIHVLLGYDRGDYRVHGRVASYALGPGYDPQAERSTATSDWAVLHLTEGVPQTVKPLRPAEEVAADAPVMVGGFARDKAYRMTADTDCRIIGAALPGHLILHDCVIAPGDSGAPLLVRGGRNAYEIAGVAVGLSRENGRAVGLAVPVTPDVLDTAAAPLPSEAVPAR